MFVKHRTSISEEGGEGLQFSKKNIVRICNITVLFILFSAVMYYPYLADASSESGKRDTENIPVYAQGSDMCLPPDNNSSSDCSEISAARCTPPIRPRADSAAQVFMPSDICLFMPDEICIGIIFCGENRTIHILRVMRC